MAKDKLMVEAICDGTVLDHIPSEKLFSIVDMLGLDKSTSPITIGNNLDSRRIGSKGVIKITDRFFSDEEINRIAILAPSIRLNIIKDYEVIEKKQISLPQSIESIVKCPNHKCITNYEPMPTKFYVRKEGEFVCLVCHYCHRSVDGDHCELL